MAPKSVASPTSAAMSHRRVSAVTDGGLLGPALGPNLSESARRVVGRRRVPRPPPRRVEARPDPTVFPAQCSCCIASPRASDSCTTQESYHSTTQAESQSPDFHAPVVVAPRRYDAAPVHGEVPEDQAPYHDVLDARRYARAVHGCRGGVNGSPHRLVLS